MIKKFPGAVELRTATAGGNAATDQKVRDLTTVARATAPVNNTQCIESRFRTSVSVSEIHYRTRLATIDINIILISMVKTRFTLPV